MTDGTRRTMYPLVGYADPDKAIEWLRRAFGFVPDEVARDDDGRIVHAQLSYDTGICMVSGVASRAAVYVAVDDVDAHHDHAKAAGAEITMPPTDQHYGSRDYAARDPEGNDWYFGTYRP